MENVYIPFASEILEVIKHTEKEFTFRMEYHPDIFNSKIQVFKYKQQSNIKEDRQDKNQFLAFLPAFCHVQGCQPVKNYAEEHDENKTGFSPGIEKK